MPNISGHETDGAMLRSTKDFKALHHETILPLVLALAVWDGWLSGGSHTDDDGDDDGDDDYDDDDDEIVMSAQ